MSPKVKRMAKKAKEKDRSACWYCGGNLCWMSDFNYDDVYCEGDGIVTFLTCMSCGAEVQYSFREDEEDE